MDRRQRFVICVNGIAPVSLCVPAPFDDAVVVAVDGGALLARRLGLRIDHVVGDLDSLTASALAALESSSATISRHPVDKDETDLELAVALVARLAADPLEGEMAEVLVLGAGCGRPDHALANLQVLAGPATAALDVSVEYAGARIQVVRPGTRHQLAGGCGSLVSLLPVLGDATGVTTTGLAYPLADARLEIGRARGVSNVITDAPASVAVGAGVLLAVEPDHFAGTISFPTTEESS